ncbi:hypothetical protein ANCDUO_04673 [Ancylostoma duodenale]|uniref:Protein kinase domain-containing protein n=1 Tax=Ancylostoma duodenale TaxID=51022 RepID=A0A0C2H6F5_9BILA|nr:hypothetical protein ANCDUO_04673 [Ancylostoma duodenale]
MLAAGTQGRPPPSPSPAPPPRCFRPRGAARIERRRAVARSPTEPASASRAAAGLSVHSSSPDLPVPFQRQQNDSATQRFSNFCHRETKQSFYGGRDTDRFFGGAFEGDESDDDVDGVDDEPPAELVPLGMRGGSGSSSVRSPRNHFYKLTQEKLGAGAYASVQTCVSIASGKEYAVKVVDKNEESHTRSRILREVNTFKMCKNQPNIVQLIEWFEDDVNFYMVFEKMRGGPLLEHIIRKGYFTEEEARRVTVDIATALKFLHDRGIVLISFSDIWSSVCGQ